VLAGDTDAAIAYIRRAAEERENLLNILAEPAFDTLRGDPRYIAVERMAGFDR